MVLAIREIVVVVRVSPSFWGLEKISSPACKFSIKKASDSGGAGNKRNLVSFAACGNVLTAWMKL